MECVFCDTKTMGKDRIVVDSKHSMAFMSIEPLIEGHLLVVSKRHVRELDELDKEELHDLMKTLGRADSMLRKTYSTPASFSYMKHGVAKSQEHLHIHLMPGFVPIREALVKYGYSRKVRDKRSLEELANVAEKIRSSGKT